MYTCALCNDSFLTLFGRIMHIQTVHGGAVPPTMIPVAPIKRHAVSLTKNSKIARKEAQPLEPDVVEVMCTPEPAVLVLSTPEHNLVDTPANTEVTEVMCTPEYKDMPIGAENSEVNYDWFSRTEVPKNEVLSSQDDGWLYNAAEEREAAYDAWLCAAAEQFEQEFNQDAQLFDEVGLQDVINEIITMDPTQTHEDFWSAMAAMVDEVEQTGGAEPEAAQERVSCPICATVFTNKRNMLRHKIFAHGNLFCPRCNQKFNNRAELTLHRRICTARGLPTNIPPSEFFDTEIFTALNKAVVTFCFKPKTPTDALVLCLDEFEAFVTQILLNYINLKLTYKIDISCQVIMHKLTDDKTKIHPIFNLRKLRPLLLIQTEYDAKEALIQECEAIKMWVEEYNQKASNWILESVEYICLNCHEVDNNAGGAGAVDLPPKIKNSRCVINLEAAPRNQCFKYAVLAAIHNNEIDNHRERITNYDRFACKYDFSSLTYPVNASQIQLFEKANKELSVWAHYSVKDQPQCLYKSKFSERPVTVHLFLYEDHWLPIVNLTALYRCNRQGTYYKCIKCFKSFYRPQDIEKHVNSNCTGWGSVQNESIPSPPHLKFGDYDKTVDMPLVMYADIEAILKPQNPGELNTKKTHRHYPAAIGNMIISRSPNNELHEKYVEHVGPNCINEFLDYLEQICLKIHAWDDLFRVKATRNFAEKWAFENATECYLCKKFLILKGKIRILIMTISLAHTEGQHVAYVTEK